MAITKETEIAKIEIVNGWNIQIAKDIVIKEDGIEISRSRLRSVLQPFSTTYTTDDKGNKTWKHTEKNISNQDAQIQSVAKAAWTDDIKAKYKKWAESQEV